jgi:hypothetical protein
MSTSEYKTYKMMFVIDTTVSLPPDINIEQLSDYQLFNILYQQAIVQAKEEVNENNVTTWFEHVE